jgi:hypothetical protein
VLIVRSIRRICCTQTGLSAFYPELANPEAIWHPIHPKSACRLHERVFVCGHDGFASRPTRWTPQINGPTFTLYQSAKWHSTY